MAQGNNQSSLANDFSFDSGTDGWFGMGGEETAKLVKPDIKESKEGKEAGKESTKIDDEEVTVENEEPFKFGGDEDVEAEEEDEVETPKKKPEATTKKEDKKDDEDEDEEDNEPDVVVADPKEVKTGEEKEQTDEEFYTALAKDLKEKGIITSEIKDDEPITEEKFFELHDQEIEARVEETFDAFKEGLDEDGIRFIQFKRDGGNTAAFLNIISRDIDFDELDTDNEKQVDAVLIRYLQDFKELEGEELHEELQDIKDRGKSKSKATQWFAKIKEEKETAINNLVEAQKRAKAANAEKAKKFSADLGQVLSKTEKVGIVPIKKDDKGLYEYITKQTFKVPNKKNVYVPQLQVDLANIMRAETPEAKQKLLALAAILKADFNLPSVATETVTQTVRTIKSNLRKAKESGFKGKSSGGYGGRKTLADNF